MSTESVVNHHLEAFGAGSADEIIKDYTEDSVLIVPDATLTGLDNIKAAFAGFFDTIFKPGTYDFVMDKVEISGDVGYILWHATCQGVNVPVGSDTFIVKDGKIAVQTFAAHIVPTE